MGKYITHLKNPVIGPIDYLCCTSKDTQSWMRRHWLMLWLSHNKEAKKWEQLENDAAKHHKEALD